MMERRGVERDERIPHLIRQAVDEIARAAREGTSGGDAVGEGEVARCVAGICAAIGEAGTPLQAELERRVRDELFGYGPLQRFLDDPGVTEIMVNSFDAVFTERAGVLERVGEVLFDDDGDVLKIIDRIATQNMRQCNAAVPYMDARLPDGSRVNAIIPPVARFGPTLTIRKFPEEHLDANDLMRFGSIGAEMVAFLEAAVRARCNILVSGGTGAGKTTLLNILAGFIPPNQRVVTIEDTAELQLRVDNWASLEARTANSDGSGEVTIHQLVVNSLRMRPDRIIVGECRSGEAVEMLQAMNTGHDGSLTTIHANDPVSAFLRLNTMVQGATSLTEGNINRQIATAIQIVVQIRRYLDGTRKVSQILALTGGTEGDAITTTELFRFEQTGIAEGGRVEGYFTATGNPCPTGIIERMNAMGVPYDLGWFIAEEDR